MSIPGSSVRRGGTRPREASPAAWLVHHGRLESRTCCSSARRASVSGTSDGREYLDCTSQAWSNNIGAGHPRVLAAAAAQAEQIAHARSNFDTIPLLLFSDRIARIAPGGLNQVGYCLHGSTAVEMALKIAAKNRPERWHRRSSCTTATTGARCPRWPPAGPTPTTSSTG